MRLAPVKAWSGLAKPLSPSRLSSWQPPSHQSSGQTRRPGRSAVACWSCRSYAAPRSSKPSPSSWPKNGFSLPPTQAYCWCWRKQR